MLPASCICCVASAASALLLDCREAGGSQGFLLWGSSESPSPFSVNKYSTPWKPAFNPLPVCAHCSCRARSSPTPAPSLAWWPQVPSVLYKPQGHKVPYERQPSSPSSDPQDCPAGVGSLGTIWGPVSSCLPRRTRAREQRCHRAPAV